MPIEPVEAPVWNLPILEVQEVAKRMVQTKIRQEPIEVQLPREPIRPEVQTQPDLRELLHDHQVEEHTEAQAQALPEPALLQ